MKALAAFFILMFLTGCQVYAGGGSLVSDGRTTTVRTTEAEVGTETGPRARTTRSVIREE